MPGSLMLAILFTLPATSSFAHPSAQPPQVATPAAAIPASLVAEHDDLHAALGALTATSGRTGGAARELERVLVPHLVKEQEYAFPPLGLLRGLAAGTITADMLPVAQLAARLKAEMPAMLAEHVAIARTVDALDRAAREERQDAGVLFAARLKLHAQNEEEVLYPAAILAGEYLRLKMSKLDNAPAPRTRE